MARRGDEGLVRSDARSELLRATADLMRRKGSANITLSEIAQHSGMNSALVRYYFGNKEGLLIALLEYASYYQRADLANQLYESNISPEDKIRNYIANLVDMFYNHPYLNKLFLEIVTDTRHKAGRKAALESQREKTSLLARLLDEGVQAGVFRAVDPMLFHFTVIGACHHIFSSTFTLDKVFGIKKIDKELADQIVQHTAEIIIRGIKL